MTVFFYMLRGFQFAAIPRKKAKRRASGIVRLARRSCSACGRTAFGRLRRPTGFCRRQKPARRACRGAAGVEGAGGRLERSESRVMCERAGRITVERFSLIMRGSGHCSVQKALRLRGFQFAAIPRKKAKRRASGTVRRARRSCSACGRTAFGRLCRPTGFCLRQKPARRALSLRSGRRCAVFDSLTEFQR